MRRSYILAALASPIAIVAATPVTAQTVTYPETRSEPLTETIFGEEIADPYRWLENDVRNDPEVAAWVEAQNEVTDAYLETLPGRDWFKERIGSLLDYERFGIPKKAGSRYFYTRNSGLQNQSPLYVQDSLDSERRVLIDPNEWAADGATALAGWTPSPDGSKLAYSVQDGGTDWRIIKVMDVATGEELSDEIRWAKFTGISWLGEEGFFYSRFPEPEEGQDFQALNYNQAVYFHRLGTPQSADELVYSTPDKPKEGHGLYVSEDGRWGFIISSLGTDSASEVRVVDMNKRSEGNWPVRELVTGYENAWYPIETIGDTLYFQTNQAAPKYRIVSIDMSAATPEWKVMVPEADQPIGGASVVGDKMVVSYLKDATTRAAVYDLQGNALPDIALGELGTAGGFGGKPGDNETFYTFTSFNRPGSIYRLDMATGETTPFATPELTFNPDDYVTEQKFFNSKDGTRVPMFIVRRKDIAESGKPSPTLLYGYGGFDISLTPSFSASRMAWMEAGGTYVLANIRGGGEYGKDWHNGGRLDNKQNVFDDFIAAGEYLKANGYTPEDGLAIQGGSNGGLLVGAVVNQRPDLFDAGNAAVGVMDMLRFDRWTAGRYWVDDYGYPDREADFKVLRAYSPYHNVQEGADYPALMVTTADTDDRVVPGHSFKYTAAIQAADLGDKPHLIRVETRAGHGAGKPTDKAIEEGADVLSFLGKWTGLEVPASE